MDAARILALLTALALAALLLAAGCGGRPADTPAGGQAAPAPDLEATVQAAVAAAMATVVPGASAAATAPTVGGTAAPGLAPIAARATPAAEATPVALPISGATATRPAGATPLPTAPASASLRAMIDYVRPAVVRIDFGGGIGSGVIFDASGESGYVLTNHHVVAGAARVMVTVNDADAYTGVVLGRDRERDLAVVSICCGAFRPLPFGDASRLRPGDEIVAIGYALGLDGPATITRGIVSAIRYAPEYRSEVIQTDAAVNPGNSGGPMLSLAGEILGINTYVMERSAGGRPVEGVNFAISGATAQSLLPVLRRPQPRPTPAPTRPRPAPTPDASEDYSVFGPMSGELRHNPANGFIETAYADVELADMLLTATFVNPYSASENPWDYGFILRHRGAGADRRLIEIIVTSQARWVAARRDSEQGAAREIGRGVLDYFDTAAGGRNTLWLAALGPRGALFVNGEFVTMLDLSGVTGAGDVAVITGAYQGSEIAGEVTRFLDFRAVRLTRRHGPVSGTLEHRPGHISQRDSGVWARDLAAAADFVNPPRNDWDYGFVIRNPQSGRLEVVGITGLRRWFHQTRGPGDAGYRVVASGEVPPGDFRERNRLLLLAVDQSGLLFVNGRLVARLDFKHNQSYGDVSIMGGFFNAHAGEPQFQNFTVWTP